MEQFFRVGVFANTHGIRGEIKVYPTTDDVNRFKSLKNVILETKRERIPLEVEGVKFFKNMVILKFKGIDNINDIEKYKGSDLLVSREDAVPLEEGEFYIADIIDIYNNYGYETEIIVAAVRNGKQIADFAAMGADIVTAGLQVYKDSFEHPFTTYGLGVFRSAWDGTAKE